MWTTEQSHQQFVYGMWGLIADQQAEANALIEEWMK